MRNDIKINDKKHTIEVTKKFAKAASYYGSEEYIALQGARKDNPNYRVITKSPSRKKSDSSKNTDSFKGLTYAYMAKYIEKHDDEDKTIMAEFEMLRATSEEAQELNAESASYKEIKEWFFDKFPAIAKFQKKREELLNVAKTKTEKTEAENEKGVA